MLFALKRRKLMQASPGTQEDPSEDPIYLGIFGVLHMHTASTVRGDLLGCATWARGVPSIEVASPI